MNTLLKKYFFTLTIFLLIGSASFSQKEFFRSQQVFKEGILDKFYSSITIHDSIILFNANDYHLYAYNKNNGSLKWSYKNNYKTSVPVFVADNIIYTAASKNGEQQAVQLSLADGKLIKELPFGPLQTKPIVKNGILFGTAIYNYGCIIAYDLQKDTVAWSRFIAHGLSRQPYYLANKILANAEGDNWVELGYDGVNSNGRIKLI
jgi:outer membrane protein assembly factor BamB